MLSVRYPHLFNATQRFRYGLMPIRLPDGTVFLVIKTSKEAILAARLKGGFRIYLISDVGGATSHLGLVTTFFDDHDKPLTMTTALFAGDDLTIDVSALLVQSAFEVYFIDEHDRELLSVRVDNPAASRFADAVRSASFPEYDEDGFARLMRRLNDLFSIRVAADDEAAFELRIVDFLAPEDLAILDARPAATAFQATSHGPSIATLVREDPGPPQERDIAVMFGRVFPADAIYLNPFRADTGKELCDVLIVTAKEMLFVEAKDSPNTEASLARTLDRKRQTIQNQIEKATKQLSGALLYARSNDGVVITSEAGPVTLSLEGRQPLGLVVVREMFDDTQFENSEPILAAVEAIQVPLMLIDYPGLHMTTQNLGAPHRFIGALHDIFDMALEHGRFPRSIWSGPPPEEAPQSA
ncbi:hypothetical protein [Brevundimonas sp. SORGH_AS_0993]|uniref:hypothetical protein n=1 Tax=Brevundimonas sp. SORGH_AS_0993 TaxID=3041794 RepID=UPI002789D894|nr:hypothetical protein [Brevundimonas sp. SORGH_AS_0993]MDQ1153095.1 hypothetical protein [Brevundimonas sp. SORGH_AS_0993]